MGCPDSLSPQTLVPSLNGFCFRGKSFTTSGHYRGPPKGFGEQGENAFISGEPGNKGQILRGTWEHRQYWGTGNTRKQMFDLGGTGEQNKLFQGNKGTSTLHRAGVKI